MEWYYWNVKDNLPKKVKDNSISLFKNKTEEKSTVIKETKEINYTLPATEKQFIGYFPSGTSISIPKEMIFGIHWENVNTHRIDLDLSCWVIFFLL